MGLLLMHLAPIIASCHKVYSSKILHQCTSIMYAHVLQMKLLLCVLAALQLHNINLCIHVHSIQSALQVTDKLIIRTNVNVTYCHKIF